ncbi:DUF6286 domain-containing protein [Nesterenkonia sp. LB17]|uniref:DUF6286 domain-containing protein n=1 Tax=Nesterenkonia sp. LB17 TaxID=2901230 RepID=UPI001F4CD75D|nr:DUF6286 domain-containing protein [Nesterenkonia sp. LB17]MCH8565942.1 DUF6286 domain-containing protein [Nesterenkonia sp. LB17]
MSTTLPARRVARRTTHSSRAMASVVTAALLILVLVWVGAETVLSALDAPALLVSSVEMGEWLIAVPQHTTSAGLVGAGVGLVLIGLALVLVGILPGRRPRHVLPSERSAMVVDDEVIAAALSRAARKAAGLLPGQVTTAVRRRGVDVRLRPTSGVALDQAAVEEAVRHELASYGLRPEPAVRVHVSNRGVVGG